jgi:hypothetical protein
MDYSVGQMQTRLALGEIHLASGERQRAAQELQLLKGESAKLGFRLLQRRAEQLLNSTPDKRTSSYQKSLQPLLLHRFS